MKKLSIFVAMLAFLPFVACHKPEVIPTPESKADLRVHFAANIDGTDVDWTKNVNGYTSEPTNVVGTDTTTGKSIWKFYSAFKSLTNPASIKIGLGSLVHDPSVSPSPSQSTFEAFMNANTNPNYSDGAQNGFEILYTDAAGDLFRSEQATPGSVTFVNFTPKSDNTGDYMQFECQFSGVVYHRRNDPVNNIDTINKMANIQNAVFTGWFKRAN
jgi:hypothetical protein